MTTKRPSQDSRRQLVSVCALTEAQRRGAWLRNSQTGGRTWTLPMGCLGWEELLRSREEAFTFLPE